MQALLVLWSGYVLALGVAAQLQAGAYASMLKGAEAVMERQAIVTHTLYTPVPLPRADFSNLLNNGKNLSASLGAVSVPPAVELDSTYVPASQ